MNLLDKSLLRQRPIPISIIAILLLLGSFLSMKSVIQAGESGNFILWYYYFSILIAILSLATAIGLLLMKKVAVYLYMSYIPISLFFQAKMSGAVNIYGVIFSTIFILIMLKYFKKMQ